MCTHSMRVRTAVCACVHASSMHTHIRTFTAQRASPEPSLSNIAERRTFSNVSFALSASRLAMRCTAVEFRATDPVCSEGSRKRSPTASVTGVVVAPPRANLCTEETRSSWRCCSAETRSRGHGDSKTVANAAADGADPPVSPGTDDGAGLAARIRFVK
jgi:hypothetical protein